MKNGKKRVLVFLTFVCLMLGWGTSVTAEAAAIDDFSLDQYRADLYTDTDSMCNQSISYMLADKNPSDTMVALLDNKPTFQTGVTSWKAIHMVSDPTYIAQGMLDEKGYYEAIIFSVFVAQQSSTDYVYDICNQITSDANKIISLVDKWVTATDGMDGVSSAKKQKMSALSADTKSKLKDFIFGEYKKEHSGLESASDISDVISTVFDTADTLADAVMTLGSYMQLVEVSDNTKAVILEMYNKCPSSNALLKDALKEAAASMDNFGAAIVTTAYSVGQKELADIVCDMLDSGWQKVLSLNPYVKAFMTGAAIGDKIGTAISNTLFATDKTIEQYVKMKCLKEFHQVLCSVVKNMGTRYQASRTTENANNYIASISVLFTEKKLSCDFAINYADVLYSDASLGWMTISSSDYNEYVRCVTSIKQLYENYEEGLEIDYRCQLEADYPELYEIYFGTDRGEDKIPVTGISFAQDEITVGVEDKECCIEGLVVSPQNATDQAVLYTSSDESVLSMWLTYSNVFIPHKTGTVTVTARSADGGYSDTITVHVVEGSTGNSAGAELPEITASGTCGEQLDWILFADGVLSIMGTGEMEDYTWSSVPWYSYRAKVTSVALSEGLESIGDWAFEDSDSLASVILPERLESIGDSAFSGCDRLTSVILPEGLESIGEYAFNSCDSLQSVTLPRGLSSIGHGAFRSCKNLKEVLASDNDREINIPEGATGVGDYAFSECVSLTSVTLPEGLKSIGNYSFSCEYSSYEYSTKCVSLTSVTLPEGLESIGHGAFNSCASLTSVTLPEGLKSIGGGAFEDCASLTSVTLPEGLKSIGGGAFEDCASLTSVTLPEGLESIGGGAFEDCASLTSVTLPEGLESIGEEAFYNCAGLTSVTLPRGLSSIGDWAFNGCETLKEVLVSDNDRKINIPEGGTGVGYCAFYSCDSLTSVTLPEGLESIGHSAFGFCDSLTSITLPGGLESIGEEAFYNCASLRSVTLPEGLESIGEEAFYNCAGLTSVTLPRGLSSIGESAFCYCENLKEVLVSDNDREINIPEDATGVGEYAFSGCVSLTSVTLPEGVKSIGEYAFSRKFDWNANEDCGSLKSVTLPEGLESIGEGAFSRCATLTSVTFAEGLENIGNNAFYECSSLTSVTFAEGLENIGNNAFYKCASLTSVTLPEGLESIGYGAFEDCASLTSVTLPEGLESIGYNTFSWCTGLTSVTLPESLESIGEHAFDSCDSLQSVTLPEGLKSIGKYAFDYCYSLQSVTLPEGLESIGDRAFSNCWGLTSVTLPQSLESIGNSAFNYSALKKVYYAGSKAEWDFIDIGDDNGKLLSARIYYHSTGPDDIPKQLTAISASKTKTTYTVGDVIGLDDLTVTAIYSDDSRQTVTHCTTNVASIDMKTAGTKKLQVTYEEDGITATAEIALKVNPKKDSTADCTHPRTTLTGRKAATCTAAGYTGDKVCDICHEVVEQGKSIPKAAHTYGKKAKVTKATTSKNGSIKGTCTVCGKTVSTKIYYAKTVSLSRTSYVYDGKAKKPSVTVRDSKGNKIAKSNYTVAYSANKNVGKGKVTVKFKGNYKGTLTKTFSIRPKATSVSKLTPKSKGFTVQWKKQSAQISGYELQYSTSSKFTRNTTKTQSIAKNKAAAKTISRLKAKKKYYVRVRTYKTVKVNGKSTKLYSDWSKVKTVTTKK